MPTAHIHRLHLIVPAAQVAAMNTAIKAQIDPTGGDWLTPNLSATGNAPFTHAQFSAALTEAQMTALHAIVATAAIQPPDAAYNSRSAASKRQWYVDRRASLAARGFHAQADDNTGDWTNPATTLGRGGLRAGSALTP